MAKFCIKCGKILEQDGKVCDECAPKTVIKKEVISEELDNLKNNKEEVNQPKRKKGGSGFFVKILVVLVLLIGVAVGSVIALVHFGIINQSMLPFGKTKSQSEVSKDVEEFSEKDVVEEVEQLPEETVLLETKIWWDESMDTNGNDIPDCLENEDTMTDTDNDGLSDYQELIYTLTDPLEKDTDGDRIMDFDEDQDGDGLVDGLELQKGTDLLAADTDGDGVSDKEELEFYGSNPNQKDTDGDGATDGWELANGYKGMEYNEVFDVNQSCETDNASVSVKFSSDGQTAESLQIRPLREDTFINNTIPGYLDIGFEFEAIGDIGRTQIAFTFDEAIMERADVKPTVYCFNEATQSWYEYNTIIRDHTAIAETTHFSKYVLLDKNEFDAYLEQLGKIDGGLEDVTDSNQDGISDKVTKLMCDGVIRTGTGAMVFGDYTYEQVQENADLDGDGLINGQEVLVSQSNVVPDDAKEFEGHYYKRFDQSTSWEDARVLCESMGGYLATPTSQEENAFIYSVINEGSLHLYWIGGYESSIEGDWHWVTAEPFAYTNWGIDEPNNMDAGEAYAEMYNYGENGRLPGEWNDMKNTGDLGGFYIMAYKGFVCEWNSSEVYVTLESSPILADTDRDGFSDALDPTPMKADVFSSMTNYKKYYFDDEITVTLCVKQPLLDSRRCYNFDENAKIETYFQSGGSGHAYLGIDDQNESKMYFGFYPNGSEATSGMLSLALLREDVSGRINGELYDESTGKYNQESSGDAVFSVAKTFVITEAQLEKILAYKENGKSATYNITKNNCSTFAVECLKESGVDVKVYRHFWTHDESSMEFYLGNDYDTIRILPQTTLDCIMQLYYGYSPGDAAQDLKENYRDYVMLKRYTLKDGSEVVGYEVVQN